MTVEPLVCERKCNMLDSMTQSAHLLEQAIRAGCKEREAFYLLAMAYKRLGRNGEALSTLARIAESDANTLLQRGLLAYAEKDFPQAERAFADSWALEPGQYAAGYNLLLAQLSQGKRQPASETMARLLPLAPPEDGRFLALLQALFTASEHHAAELHGAVASLSAADEARLVDLLSGLGQFDVVLPLLEWLLRVRPDSRPIFLAYLHAALLHGKNLIDRARWQEANELLGNLARRSLPKDDRMGDGRIDDGRIDGETMIVLLCMAGTCACVLQDFEKGLNLFRAALDVCQSEPKFQGRSAPLNSQGVPQQAWLEQNLALAFEWQGRLDRAEAHWNRYFDILEAGFAHSRPPDYLPALAFAGLTRLGDIYSRKEKWQVALGFFQRAHKLRPADHATLEQIFQLYSNLRRPDEARKILRRLREVRPQDPQVELFELDVRELRDLEDLDRLLADIRRVVQKFPGNLGVEERAATMIANLIPFMERLAEQFTAHVNKVIDQMRRLPSYQINWPVVREIMREQEDKFYQLRRAVHKSLNFVTGDARGQLNRLIAQCDRKIEKCHTLGE